MSKRENILFQVSWELLLRGDILYHLHISITPSTRLEYRGKKGEISSDLAPRCRQNGRQCVSAGPPLWLNATCPRWGSNQSSPLLAQSEGIFIDTSALTLAPGCALSAGGPGLLLSLPVFFLFRGTIVCHDLQEFVDTTCSTPGTRCTILKKGKDQMCSGSAWMRDTSYWTHASDKTVSKPESSWWSTENHSRVDGLRIVWFKIKKNRVQKYSAMGFSSDTSLIRNIYHWVYAGGIRRQRSVHLQGAPV